MMLFKGVNAVLSEPLVDGRWCPARTSNDVPGLALARAFLSAERVSPETTSPTQGS